MLQLLVVDDSNLIRNRIARIAGDPELGGLQIIGMAADGEQALRICQRQRPDLVTLDLTMPNMDGITCVAEITQYDPSIRVLVVSALNDKLTALQAMENGARGFLHKPFTDQQLLWALRELVS